MTTEPEYKHLIVLVHGFYGLPTCWNYSSQELKKGIDPSALIHISVINNHFVKGTEDGIDQSGIRLSMEVLGILEMHKSIEEISFVGMSMGGLISRYAIGVLYREDGSLAGKKANSFISFASPHLGTRGQVNWITENAFSHFPLVKTTCDQFFMRDTDNGKKAPLLLEMTRPESNFYKGLATFRKRVAYGNVENDHRTSYQSGTIWPYKLEKPYTYHPEYPTLVPHKVEVAERVTLTPFYAETSEEWLAAQNLSQLPWTRIGCHFDGWFAKWLNHTNIIVAFEKMNAIGKNVVKHFVDTFME